MAAELDKNQVVILFNEGANDEDGDVTSGSPPHTQQQHNDESGDLADDAALSGCDNDAQTTPPEEIDAQPVTPTDPEEPLLPREDYSSSAVKNMEGENGATVVVNFSKGEKAPDDVEAVVRVEGDRDKETEPVKEPTVQERLVAGTLCEIDSSPYKVEWRGSLSD